MVWQTDPFPEMRFLLNNGKKIRISNYPKEYDDQLSVFGYVQYKGRPLTTIESFITPVKDFFVRNHLRPPIISEDSWKLKLVGCFKNEGALSLNEIKQFNHVTRIVSIECTGNQRLERNTIGNVKALARHVDILSFDYLLSLLNPARLKWWVKFLSRAGIRAGRMVANGAFTGVRLFDVLRERQLTEDAKELVFEGLDKGQEFKKTKDGMISHNYARSMEIDKLKKVDPILCFEMNGMPLTHEHGFPLRMIMPGIYGHEHVKWLGRIIATSEKFRGYYQKNTYGYKIDGETVPVHDMRPKSVVIRVVKKGPQITVYGVAWRGMSPIERIGVSVNGLVSWNRAEILFKGIDFSWLFWKCDLQKDLAGLVTITPRAFCENGDCQPLKPGKYSSAYGNNSVFSAVVKI